jgi:hypothetical protein
MNARSKKFGLSEVGRNGGIKGIVDYSKFGLPDFAGVKKRDYFLALVSGDFLQRVSQVGTSIFLGRFVPCCLPAGEVQEKPSSLVSYPGLQPTQVFCTG